MTASERNGGLLLEHVGVRYPATRKPALEGVTLSVGSGELMGVAGRTGAGKSTLALTAAGFIPRVIRASVEGHVRTAGITTTTAHARDLLGRVGIVFATPANQLSASKLTVREELAFGLENLAVPRAEMDRRIDAVLQRLGIEHLAEREPFALSGGEQQRVAIASIVTMGTNVLVLDEPTAQLDPAGTAGVADLLVELGRAGVSVLAAEHDPLVHGRLDRTVVLHEGRVAVMDIPGRALGSDALTPIGLTPPTLVELAEAAGLDPRQAFEEGAVAEALRHGLTRRDRWAAPARSEDVITWAPVRDRMPVAVEVRDLVHRYATGIEAVRGVSLRIEPGEAVAIVGQNGSGKTTLAKHLNGLLRPSTGSVWIDGRDATGEAVHLLARTVGFVFQNPDDQLFERTVEREVAFGPRTMGFDADEAEVHAERAIAAVGLEDARSINPYDLDLSRRKLVSLASVLATDPAVVVLDEPTTGQDAPGVARVGGVVEALRSTGRTIVAITHDMEFAARHFTRIVVMRGGEIIGDGRPSTVFAPANADLLASTGLEPPPAARVAARLGLGDVPLDAGELLRLLAQ